MSIQPHQKVIPKLLEGVVTHRGNTDFLCSQIIRNPQGNLHKLICKHGQGNHIRQVARSGNVPNRASLGYQRDALCSASVCPRREISHRNRRSVRSHSKSQTSIYALVRKGIIPAYKRGKKLYFYKEELLQWVESGRKGVLYTPSSEEQLATMRAGMRHKPKSFKG